MENILFKDVALLVNRIGNTSIDADKPFKESKSQWAIYDGLVQAGGIAVPFKVLYLQADAGVSGVQSALAALSHLPETTHCQVVYPQSLPERLPDQFKTLKSKAKNILSIQEYFSSFIRQQIELYLRQIKDLPHKHYIDPQIEVPAGMNRRFPNSALLFLNEKSLASQLKGEVGILLGEPGQGKTFMSRYLASSLTREGLIPVYVHSEQWSRMQREDLSSIWKTILHSFRYFDAPISWAEGAELEFLKVALKAGLFRIIFDGFDEYVLWNQGKVDALDAIQTLRQLADETGTRILVTSRTSFWDAEILEQHGQAANFPTTFTIAPFDANHARNYFKIRFPDSEAKVHAASALFSTLLSKSTPGAKPFVGRGFFLYLIADLIGRDFSASGADLGGMTVTQWIMDALCERERERQKLPLSSQQQLSAFREFSVSCISDFKPNSETLRMIVQLEDGVTLAQADELVGVYPGTPGKLKDHPLIRRNSDNDEWSFVQDQITFTLIAERVILLCNSPKEINKLEQLVSRKGFTTNLQSEVASSIVEQSFDVADASVGADKVRRIVGALLKCGRFDLSANASANPASLACVVALLANSREHRGGSLKLDRTRDYISLFPDGKLKNLCFTGTMSKFDFSDVIFENCHFDQVTFASCKFSDRTRFEKCRFSGGNILSCEDLGFATWSESCLFDADARAIFDAVRVKAGKKLYKTENLKIDISYVIRKFVPKEGAGIKRVEERNLTKGPISHSPHKNLIIEYFKKHLIEPHNISGSSETGYNVRKSAEDAVLHYAANGVPTGPMAEMLSALVAKLGLTG